MEKKLLSVFFTFSLFFLNPFSGFGQACPTSVSISSDTGTTICAGTDVTFNANFTGGTGTLSYQWKSNGSDVQTGGTSYGPVKPTNGQKIEVVVTSSDNAACSTTGSITMTVNPQRTGSVTIQASNTNICPGDNINFSISNISNAGSGATYVWKVNGSQTGTNSTNFSSTLSNNDKVTLTVQSSVPCTPEFTSNEITIIEKPGKPNTPGAISGNTEVCPGDIVTYSISSVTNASTYTWSVPSGWTINTGQNSTNITVTAGNAGQNGNISVTASNDCGTSSNNTLGVTVKPGTPASPGTITGTKDVCPGDSVTYSIDSVTNADANGYIWSVPSGWTINSGQNSTSITVTAGNAGQNGNISVNASNSCGTSSDKTLGVTVKPGTPSTPGTITGTPDVCPGGSVTYSISSVTNADPNGYTWSVPSGWTINSGQNSTSITVTAGNAGQNGNISANASNSCGTSSDKTLGVTVKPGTPATPGTITGTPDVCPGGSVTYSISSVTNADANGYTWSVPSGWTINSGQNSTSITVTAGNAGQNGNISANASNSCGTSSNKTLGVTVKPGTPATPGTITGTVAVCASATGLTYSVAAVTDATSYNWSLPLAWVVQSGAGTRNITVNAASASGNITVTAQNNCGTSSAQTLAVTTTNGVPAQPGTITSSLGSNPNICPPLSGVTFNVTAVGGATSYLWTLPTGFQVTSGANSNSITVKVNSSQTYNSPVSVSVQAVNLCGPGISRTYSGIEIGNYILTDIGPDQTVCKTLSPVTINGTVTFGSAKFKPAYTTSGGGSFPGPPSNNVSGNFSFTYQPIQADLNAGQVTITFTVPKPNGNNSSCGNGIDDMVIYFRDAPTANISAGPTICAGSATDLTITGTANTTVTYKEGSGANQKVDLGSGGSAPINTGNLNSTTTFQLVSSVYNSAPTCQASLNKTSTVTVTPVPTATISYSGTPFCTSDAPPKSVTLSGTGAYQNGVYSVTPTGLTIDSASGNINPSTSNPGTYTVKYTVPASGGCSTVEETTQVTITKLPTSSINYSGTPFCQSLTTAQPVTLSGTDGYSGGSFSSNSGLTINSSTGAITPSTSTPGTYTITYTTPAANGCGTTTSTSDIVITETPTPQIEYSPSEFCTSETSAQNVILTGGGNISDGTFTAPVGLSIISLTGTITPSTSTPGIYSVTYTLSPDGGCGEITTTKEVIITQDPSVDISYNGPYCTSDPVLKDVIYSNPVGAYENGTFISSPSGLNITADGKINPSSSTAGTYTVTYTIPDSGGCSSKDVTTTVEISEAPEATIGYIDSPFCNSDINAKAVSYTETAGAYEGGAFSSTSGLTIDENTGDITPSTSTPGTYTVSYTIPAGDGCGEITATTDIQIYNAPQITTQPFNVAVCTANSAQLEVQASGDNLSYQWYKGTGPGTKINGATSAVLSINQATTADGGVYYVIVSGESSCTTDKSDEVTLNVDENIVITTQPQSQDICEDGTLNLSIAATATGGNPQYQWRKDGSPLSDDGRISGATTANLNISNLTSLDDGDYDVIIDGPDGYTCDTGYSNPAVITITPTVTINAFAPTTSTRCQGAGIVTTTTTATNFTGITYSLDAASITGRNTIDAASGAVTYAAGWSGTTTITASAAGCNGPATTTHEVTITPTVTINAFAPTTSTRCQGAGTVTTTTTATNFTGITYSLDAASITGGNTIDAASGAVTYAAGWSGTTTITASAAGCNGPATTTHEVTITPTVTINAFAPTTSTRCQGAGTVTTTTTATNFTGITYSLDAASITGGNTIDAASGAVTYAAGWSGTTTITASAAGCNGPATTTHEVTITPTVTINAFAPTTSTRCQGAETVTTTTTATNSTGITYSLDAASRTGGNAIEAASGAVTYAAGWSGTTIITASAAGCNGPATTTHEVTITPTVTIKAFAPTTSTRCQGAGIVTTTTTATNSTVITYSLDAASITGGNTIDAASGAVTYAAGWSGTTTITASAAGCNGPATTTHEVTITPTVTINAFAPTTSTRCQGAGTMTTTTTATNFTGITYSLDATSLTGGNTIVAASGAVTYAAGWSGTTTITASAAGCNGPATTTHVVTVTPTVTINAFSPATSTRCQGAGTLTTTTTANNSTGITYSLDAASLTGGNTIVAATGAVTYAATWSGTTTITASAAGCNGPATTTHVVTIDPVPVGGKLLFNGTDRIFLICEEPADGYAVPLTLSGKIGAVVKWQFRTSTATSWSDLIVDSQIFTGTSLAAADIETLNISEATVFRAEINSGACLPNVFSETAIISVIPSNMEPSPVTVDKPVICIGDEVQLSSETGYGISFGKFEGGAFDNSSITNFGWRITDENGNTDYNFSSNADNRRPDKWLRTNPHDFATANITTNAITNQRWDTSLDSEGNKGFAIVSGDHPSTLETAVFSLSGLDEAILTFDQAFNLTSGASIQVEISTNGGASYTSEPILYYQAGPASSDNYNHFGNGTPDVNQMEIDLGDYIGFGNLRIRFKYDGTKDGDIWALDNIKVPEGPRGVTLNWTDYTDPENPIYIGSSNTETWTPSKIGWNTFVVKTELILDSAGNTCSSVVNSKEVKVFAFDQYTSTASSTGGTCGAIEVQLHGEIAGATSQELMTLPTPDGYTASWTVVGPSGYNSSASATHFFPSVNDPNAIFTPGFSGNYTLTWTMTPNAKDEAGNLIINPGCPPVYNPVTFDIEDCTTLDFDGEDDYVDLGTGYTGTYSIELWIRPESSTGTIISGPTFEIKMADLPSSVAPNTRWYHIAVSGGKLYIDGIESGSAGSGNGGSSTLIGARSTSGEPENYFSGWIEEVRIWKKAITPDQIQFMMNQHLENAGNMGVEIPMPVPGGLVYGDLAGYYRLISKVPDPLNLVTFPAALYPLNGFTPDLALNAVQGRLYNMTTNQENTAPMPYISGDNGDWETGGNTTWLRPSVWDDPNSKGIDGTTPIEWNIVRTKHNIKSKAKDITVLGLISETGEINMMDPGSPANEYNKGQFLRVTHYLKLDGVIDLEGESQLLQDSGSILDEASAGYLERDQQGKRNSFVYNYWSSPVSPQGGKTNNAPYSVKSVLMDGTIPATPTTINFRPGYWEADWARTTPNITISAYWLWGYKPATADIYAEWDWIHEDGPLNTGEGFTMKGTDGTASISAEQNYTFRGKPHNGDFDLSMGAGQNYLIGNPYPSAMDADEFIRNNIKNGGNNDDSVNVFDGALYFWDHFEKLNHILIEYIGGYATYNFIGGVPAISDDYRINANDAQGSKYPGPYIPVAQAFLINSSDVNAAGVIISGGDVHFKNSQRSFQREQVDDSQFLKPEVNTKTNKEKTQEKSKIRISFKSPVGYYRQILVGAIPSATNGFDLGYDALLFDDNVEDMYWMQGDNNLVIQGVSNFDKDQILPLGIKIKENKEFKIKIDTLENAPSEMNVYLNDKLKDSIHDLKAGAYVSTSEPGYIHDRFEIIFFKEEPPVIEGPIIGEPQPEVPIIEDPQTDFTTLSIKHAHDLREIQILNPDRLIITSVYLFDLNGNLIENYTNIPHNQEINLRVKNYSSGVYLLKVYAEGKIISKKIIISN